MALVIAVIAACIAGGLRVWDTARAFQTSEAEMTMGLDMMERDLINAVPFYGIEFEGETRSVTFPGWVSGEDGERRIGAIRYRFDVILGRLLRDAWVFPGDPPDDRRSEALASRIRAFEMEYFVFQDLSDSTDPSDQSDTRGQWADSATNFPAAVRIRLTLDEGSPPISVTRTIVRPVRR